MIYPKDRGKSTASLILIYAKNKRKITASLILIYPLYFHIYIFFTNPLRFFRNYLLLLPIIYTLSILMINIWVVKHILCFIHRIRWVWGRGQRRWRIKREGQRRLSFILCGLKIFPGQVLHYRFCWPQLWAKSSFHSNIFLIPTISFKFYWRRAVSFRV